MITLGIDTSNYTTSAALFDSQSGQATQRGQLLPVPKGEKGLRQSDAVFAHLKQLPTLLEQLMADSPPPECVGVSLRPRDVQGSYMPCFLAGETTARAIGAAGKIPVFGFSHQAGHIAAALFGAQSLDLASAPFLAFHASGGTTECLNVKPGQDIPFEITLIGETLDLSAGQVIDRVGVMLGLPFPAGPHLEQLAEKSANALPGKPVLKGGNCCLSGLENQSAALIAKGHPPADVAAFCQCMVGQTILGMAQLAASEYPGLPFVFAGGVMCNETIRKMIAGRIAGAKFAPANLSADNAAGPAILAQMAMESGWRHC
ncbi:MAG: peptidase M22 [Oscillospiraceae bacterium]|nr:peptidase M22 [Oscillospiraceae bacterium]